MDPAQKRTGQPCSFFMGGIHKQYLKISEMNAAHRRDYGEMLEKKGETGRKKCLFTKECNHALMEMRKVGIPENRERRWICEACESEDQCKAAFRRTEAEAAGQGIKAELGAVCFSAALIGLYHTFLLLAHVRTADRVPEF